MDNMDYSGKRLLFIGASGHYELAIKKAKEMGITTIVINFNKNATAKKYADIAADVDTYDPDQVIRFAKEQRVDGLFTSWNEVNLYTTEYVAGKLGMPFYATKSQLDALVTKYEFKRTCRRYGVPVIPEYYVGDCPEKKHIESFEYPVIFKPTDSGGTRGMTILHDQNGVEKAFEKALSASAKKEVVVEKYLQNGALIVIDMAVQDGKPMLACVADRSIVRTSENAVPLAISYMYPSKSIDIVEEQAFGPLSDMVCGLGIKNGIISFEGIISEEKLYIIETQFRFGGTHFYEFVKRSSGADLLEMMIDQSMSGRYDRYDLAGMLDPRFDRPYACQNLQVDPGKIISVNGIDEVRKIPGVDWFIQIKNLGDTVPADGSTAQNFAKIGLSGNSDKELYGLMNRIQNTLEVLDENGNNLVRKNIPREYY